MFFARATYQLVIESRVTSDDLQQAVSANTDKIVAVQSSVDSALGDNLRRTQDMVQSQVLALTYVVCKTGNVISLFSIYLSACRKRHP